MKGCQGFLTINFTSLWSFNIWGCYTFCWSWFWIFDLHKKWSWPLRDANSKIYSRLTNGSTWYSLKMTIFQNWFRLLIQILNTWNKFVFNDIVQNCGVGGERRRINGDIVEKIEGTNDNMQMELMHLTPLCSLCHQATLAPRTFLLHLLTLLF